MQARLIVPHIAIAVALTWPLGALAVDLVIGSETDGGKAAGVAGWTERQDRWAERDSFVQEPRGQNRRAWRGPVAFDASGHVYRYGQRGPVLEELVSADRGPDNANTIAPDR